MLGRSVIDSSSFWKNERDSKLDTNSRIITATIGPESVLYNTKIIQIDLINIEISRLCWRRCF
jgi:hypothetical protein